MHMKKNEITKILRICHTHTPHASNYSLTLSLCVYILFFDNVIGSNFTAYMKLLEYEVPIVSYYFHCIHY